MAHGTIYTTPKDREPGTIHIDSNHIAEVRKQGQQLGIYTLTTTGKKRGILLPIDTWYSLLQHSNLINVLIDVETGVLTKAKVTETVSKPSQHIHTVYNQQQSVKCPCINNGSTTNRGPSRHVYACHRPTPYHVYNKHHETTTSTTDTTTTIAAATANADQVIYKQDPTCETVSGVEFFTPYRPQCSTVITTDAQETFEAHSPSDVDAFCTAYVC